MARVPPLQLSSQQSRTGNPLRKSERLGHGNPAFTSDTYQHVLPGLQAKAARTFENLIAGSR